MYPFITHTWNTIRGRCKIVKAKNWVDTERNPNNWVISFKLVDGCRIIPGREGWQRETIKEGK